MIERIITLDEIDPVDIFGINNKLIDLLSSYFPKMKVVARGSEIFLRGSISDIRKFEEKLNILIEVRGRKSRLNEDDINCLFDGSAGSNQNESEEKDIIVYGTDGKIIRTRTKNQRKLVASYYHNDLIFALGPAGTGKTYTAIALAVRALKNKEVKKLILTRPAVEAGERLGFLPGDLREKLDPYLQPLYDALRDMLPSKKLQSLMEEGIMFLTRMGSNIKGVTVINFGKEDIVRHALVSKIVSAFEKNEESGE
ncbi:MAG: PhoH family protein [Bacteroidales bacterium]